MSSEAGTHPRKPPVPLSLMGGGVEVCVGGGGRWGCKRLSGAKNVQRVSRTPASREEPGFNWSHILGLEIESDWIKKKKRSRKGGRVVRKKLKFILFVYFLSKTRSA